MDSAQTRQATLDTPKGSAPFGTSEHGEWSPSGFGLSAPRAPDPLTMGFVDGNVEDEDTLRRELVAVDALFSRRPKDEVDHADFVWRQMMFGQWALDDNFELGGRRFFILAFEETRRPLSEKAERIAKHHANGASSKSVALALGYSASTVCAYLVGALVKCRLRSRGELASFHDALFGAGADRLRVSAVRTADRAFLVVSRALTKDATLLTTAERAVAQLVADGLSNQAIATRRRTSVRTVDNQLAALMRKLGAPSRHHVAARAMRGLESEHGR